MPITDWPASERPREKLLSRGSSTLSDAELLAIFLRTGCQGKSAVDLARQLLKDFGSLRAILDADQRTFCTAHGLGQAKYAQLQAVLEMAHRHLEEKLARTSSLQNSSAVRDYLTAKLRARSQEVFAVLFLDSQYQLLNYKELFFGTLNTASIYPREVVKEAIAHNAASIIVAHNHPSGICEPSQADRHITDTLKKALDLIDVLLLDHVVIGEGETFSFAEHGWL